MRDTTNSADPSESQTYRLIITRRSGAELLLTANGSGWALPQVSVSPRLRLAEQVTTGTRSRWGLETYCLFLPRPESACDTGLDARFAVMEALSQNAKPPAGLYWMPYAAAIRRGTLPKDDQAAVEGSLHEMSRYAAEPGTGPFGRPGWIKELFEWVENNIAQLGLRVTGAFQQFNGSASFSLMRIETSGPAVWFKATGEPNRHELPVTTTLAQLFPGYVPKLLAIHPAWNAWLSWEVTGSTLDNFGAVSAWERAARTLAELQITSIGRSEELLQCGCRDFRAGRLIKEIDPFLAHMRECMEMQKKQSPAALTRSQLEMLGGVLTESCSTLQQLDLPNTLGHLDFNPGNILVSLQRCVILDWAEACVANPFITFAYLREHCRRHPDDAARAEEKITRAYLRPWQAMFSPNDLLSGMTLSSLVAVLAYAIRVSRARASEAPENPASARYLRSLTRRMHREALRHEERSESCMR